MKSEFENLDEPAPPKGESTTFAGLNLEEELVNQYHAALQFRNDIVHDTEESASGRAAVFNVVTSILEKIVRLKTEVYNSERLKVMEDCLIKALQQTDPALTDRFLALYEAKIEHLKSS